MKLLKRLAASAAVATALVTGSIPSADAQQRKPNILVIWGDDVGYWNVSAYNHGMMGYETPNIDSLAKEGGMFTDCLWSAELHRGTGRLHHGPVAVPHRPPESRSARSEGRPSEGRSDHRGSAQAARLHHRRSSARITWAIATSICRPFTASKNSYGSLYHLNAEEEAEDPDYFKDPELIKRFGTRGVLHSWANPDGTQRIEGDGPLTKKRMETFDQEIVDDAVNYLDKAKTSDKPFFLWVNFTRMHIWTHLKPDSQGKTGLGLYPDGMVEHDGEVGQVLDKLKSLGLDDNTIVMYSTDNGAEKFSWPDGGQSPFRGEKNTNWEGGFRVPTLVRWPGVIKPGTVFNDIVAHEDWLPTFLAAAGAPDVKEKLLQGDNDNGKPFKVHLDGYNLSDYLAGTAPSPRKEFFYFGDDGQLLGLRFNQWKLVFQEQKSHGLDVWQDPFIPLRFPKLFNLRSDPFETADEESINYGRWRIEHAYLLVPAQQFVGQFLSTFKAYPPRQEAGSFSVDQALKSLIDAGKSSN